LQVQKAKPGYKLVKSLFGKYDEIPEDWQQVKLIEKCVGSPEYGANVSAIKKNPKLSRYIRITDLNDNGSLRDEEWKSIAEEDARNYLLQDGDVLFARTGATVGKTYHYKKNDGNCAFAGYLIRFVPDSNQLDSNFLFYFTHSRKYWKWLTAIQTWGVQPNVNAEQYSNMPILLPSIEQQEKISSIISNVDSLIQKTDESISQAKKLQKGIMQQVFHPKENEKLIEEKLGEKAKFSSGEFLPKKNQEAGTIPVFGGNGITGWHNKSLVNRPTIVFGRVGAYCGSVHLTKSSSWITDNAIFIKELSEEILVDYLFRFLKRLNINLLAEVTAQPKISQGILNHLLIRYPAKKIVQRKIISILDNFDSKISYSKSQKSNLQILKKGLMQKLLTGQFRV